MVKELSLGGAQDSVEVANALGIYSESTECTGDLSCWLVAGLSLPSVVRVR